jgi:hypothetical protein
VKQFYARTNHRGFERQIACHERRVARLQRMKRQFAANENPMAVIRADDEETLPHSDPSEHYHISHSRKVHFNVTKWLADNQGDKAIEVFFIRDKIRIVLNISGCRIFFRH